MDNNTADKVGNDAAGKRPEAAETAKSILQNTAAQLRDSANVTVDRAATDVGQQLIETTSAARESLSVLRERQPALAALAERSLDRAERAATTLTGYDLNRVIDETTVFAEKRPQLFVGGVAIAGLVIGRLLQQVVEAK